MERLGRLSIGFHIPLVHSVRNEFKTLCGRAEKPHPAAREQPQTFFFSFATQFFFFISSYFQKIDKKYQNFPGGPGFGAGGIPGRSPIVSDNCKNSPAGCPPALRPQSRVVGEGRETLRGRGGVERARAAWILLAGREEQNSFKNLQKIGAAEKKHKSHMKTKRGVWAFQPTEFNSGKVPHKGDPKGQRMAGGASARQARLRARRRCA